MPDHLRSWLRATPVARRAALLVVAAAFASLFVYLGMRFTRDKPVAYESNVEHFKYGSTGGERGVGGLAGVPYLIWQTLPELFQKYLPRPYDPLRPYAAFGFIYEPGKDLPVGVSRRNVQGIDRVFVNCAVCHVGTVRDTPQSSRRLYVAMPANTVDLERFERFLFDCATDPDFTPERIMAEAERIGVHDDFINRAALRYFGIHIIRDRLLALRGKFLPFLDRGPHTGPGRVDTFNPPKVLLGFQMDKLPRKEWVGVTDLPSIWLQRARRDRDMKLHWDGNNTSVEERNRSAAFGTAATPPTLDRASMKRIASWLLDAEPPKYPYPIDQAKAARGATIYAEYCASCHGRNGRDFDSPSATCADPRATACVGRVTPIDHVRTDRHRLDSYTFELAVNQNVLYAGYGEERFSHFRKTDGYANMPLDGIWLRSPYLHNGSVPTLRDLLNPVARRPLKFRRGYDVFDAERVGYRTDVASENGVEFFEYDTQIPGNGNYGHEGRAYGTLLSGEDKDALVEHLKTF